MRAILLSKRSSLVEFPYRHSVRRSMRAFADDQGAASEEQSALTRVGCPERGTAHFLATDS
jgi:hypothetical protein